MCLYPKLIINRKYTKTKKNGGVIPIMKDPRVKYVPVGCEQCIECRKQKSRSWQGRLLEDIKDHKNGKFITLTFSNESIKLLNEKIDEQLEGYERDNELATTAVRLFLERWRKKYGKSLRHWFVTELGHKGTENIHIHGIVWTNESTDEIINHWKYGYVWRGYWKNGKLQNYVNERTVNYIIKYVNKIDKDHYRYKSKVLTSPGIGSNFIHSYDVKHNKYNGKNTIEYYRTRSGHKINLPIYWRNKLYSEGEREILWLNRLDKNERWVCGEQVKLINGDELYWNLLKYHRRRSIKLGYGDDTKNWSRIQYEREKRHLKYLQRLENAA